MRPPGEVSSDSWNAARIGAMSLSMTTPPTSRRSIAKEAISWALGALTSLPIEFSGPGVSPRDSAVIVRNRVSRTPCVFT